MDIKEFAQEFLDNINVAVEMGNTDYDQELASAILEFLEVGRNSFYVSLSAMKRYPNRYSKKGYRIEIVGKLKDFEVEE